MSLPSLQACPETVFGFGSPAVHHDIEEVNAPIDQRAAAGNGFRREGAAETRIERWERKLAYT